MGWEPTVVETESQSAQTGSWSGDPGQGGEWTQGQSSLEK